MAVSINTRKPVDQLCAKDFTIIPLWEYAIDEEGVEGRDETWVRPVGAAVVPRRGYTLVAADFAAAGGAQLEGFVIVSTLDGKPEVSQATIFHDGKSLPVPEPGSFEFENWRNKLLTGLGLADHNLFPLSYRLRVPLQGNRKFLEHFQFH